MREIIKKVCLGAVALFCAIVAGCAFLLSYTNLRELAEKAGISSSLSPLWPICLDSLLVVSSIAILYNNLSRKGSLRLWAIFIAFSLGSLWFNVSNSPDNLQVQLVHALPPCALCVAIEILTYMLRSKLDEGDSLSQNINDGLFISESVCIDKNSKALPHSTQLIGEKEKVLEYFIQNPRVTYRQAGEDLNLSPSIVSMRAKQLVEEGFLAKEVVFTKRGRKPNNYQVEEFFT
ncbi:putative transcriptional regulator, AsnC family [Methanospirillum hungatei JF-1]|uniref:Transcriptional regulator, AsnC family n=1 Tax=Methanospirillum hungatei JF-1 (strain ATCC 27890 / DSM 864 / NBRC 100397 / JF-1) TaxID=323259 RepID=Q2FSQ8_METHJ|nr:DUF2637 domain-containing protein [Methanospirillum hungatei]ABD42536.1 putative transcriptional regulator, AsnC family [Methanospirillum hungatei JF-1]